jgi:hypothetical protein
MIKGICELLRLTQFTATAFLLATIGIPLAAQDQPNAPISAVVLSQQLDVYSAPSISSLRILQLKQGTLIEIIGSEAGFAKIRYRLEGEFPIEGFALEAGLQRNTTTNGIPLIKAKQQDYEAQDSLEPVTEAAPLADALPSESPDASLLPQPKPRESRLIVSKPKKRSENRLRAEGNFGIGFQTLSEDLTTKPSDSDSYATEPFLSYEMSGILFDFKSRMTYRASDSVEVGFQLNYDFTVFRGSVAAPSASLSPNIDESNVQALMHDVQSGPYIRYEYRLNRRFAIEPELSILGAYKLFTTNQLKTNDDLAPGLQGQTVLMNWQVMQVLPQLSVNLRMPSELSLKAYIALGVWMNFSESPTTTTNTSGEALPEEDMIRTGAPSSAPLVANYGAQLNWNLKRLGVETVGLVAFFNNQDVSRTFSGSGNRASMLMKDTKASTRILNFGIGAEYLF